MLEGFTWYKQSAFKWLGDGLTIYIDPWGIPEGSQPADAVLITHAHFDHFSVEDIHRVHGSGTKFFAPADVAAELAGDVTAVAPGDSFEAAPGVKVQAVPAYNTLDERLDFHPKANKWVGYILELGGHTYYHAGDTDHAEELNSVKADVAFLPIGGTYTMTPPEAAGMAKALAPRIAVPMHYGFVVGEQRDGEVFKQECAPDVRVELLEPERPWGEGASD